MTLSEFNLAIKAITNNNLNQLIDILDNSSASKNELGRLLNHSCHFYDKQNSDIVKYLIRLEANVNYSNMCDGEFPLSTAMNFSNIEIVKELIKAGANYNSQNPKYLNCISTLENEISNPRKPKLYSNRTINFSEKDLENSYIKYINERKEILNYLKGLNKVN